MSYEELKQQVYDKLLSLGFEKENIDLFNDPCDSFVKTNIHQQQVIINGHPSVHEDKQVIRFTCIGEGYIDDKPLIGFSLTLDRNDVGDFWVSRLNDFNMFFNIR